MRLYVSMFFTITSQISLRAASSDHRILPQELAQDIQQFMTSDFAQSYFSTHRRGLIFRRRVPLEEMMTWQKVGFAVVVCPA